MPYVVLSDFVGRDCYRQSLRLYGALLITATDYGPQPSLCRITYDCGPTEENAAARAASIGVYPFAKLEPWTTSMGLGHGRVSDLQGDEDNGDGDQWNYSDD